MTKEVETTIFHSSGARNRMAIMIPRKLTDDSTFKLKIGDRISLKITAKGFCVTRV